MLGSRWTKSSDSAYNGNCVEAKFVRSNHSTGNGACVEISYNKSSHSSCGECVEVGYKKSSRSTNNGACVETGGPNCCGAVHVRDSKNPEGGILSFSPEAWQKFVDTLKTT